MAYFKKYGLILGILVIVLILGWFKLYLLQKEVSPANTSTPHFYKEPSRDISRINIEVFYAVPKNKLPYGNWRDLIAPVLADSVKFHELQFRGTSRLEYNIIPQIFFLENESIFYDTDKTDRGNPEGLKNIISEIKRRVPDVSESDNGILGVIAVIYEGVGASGTDGAMILSRTFLSDDQYKLFRSSLFYHEFGHTFGLPDQYDLEHSIPYSNDIMGAGRHKPIDLTYIDEFLLKELGIIK